MERTRMLVLNNAKTAHNRKYTWKIHRDYSESGSLVYARGSLIEFRGTRLDRSSVLPKRIGANFERDNISYIIETVAQFPFMKDDIIIDDMGKEYIVVSVAYIDDENQSKYLRSAYISRRWYLGVEGDE
jgi:hypothetical protein